MMMDMVGPMQPMVRSTQVIKQLMPDTAQLMQLTAQQKRYIPIRFLTS